MLSEHDTFISILKGPRCHPVEYYDNTDCIHLFFDT